MSGAIGVRSGEPFAVAEISGLGVRVVGLTDDGLGNTSWLVDVGGDAALVVDPERAPEP